MLKGSFLTDNWIIESKKLPKNPYLILGMPGIGNVAKISADYIIDKLKLKPIATIYGKYFPHSVIVNKDGTIDLPKVSIYHFKNKDNEDIVVVTGESQPITEEATYELAELLLKLFDYKIKELIALAGKGFNAVPEKVEVSIVANNKTYLNKLVKELQKISKDVKKDNPQGLSTITGLAGITPALAKIFNIKASTWMADTYADPFFLGFNSAYKLLLILKEYLKFDIDMKELENESKKIEEIVKRGGDIIRQIWEEQKKKQKEEKDILKKYYS